MVTKSRYIFLCFGVFIAFLSIVISCKKHAAQPQEETLSEPQLPDQSYDYYSKHLVNNDMATLGRVLFYDRNLSGNNTISCGSCHKQQYAFADNTKLNKGFSGLELKRNSPSIQNIRGFKFGSTSTFANGVFTVEPMSGIPSTDNQLKVLLFWDARQDNMSDMVLNPVMNHNEMNMPDFNTLTDRLKQLSYYPALFKKAYGDEGINKERIAFALEAFLCCLNTTTVNQTSSGIVDDVNSTVNTSTLTGMAELGRQLFHNKYNCAQCHDPQNSGGYDGGSSSSSIIRMFNIGLDQVYTDNGLGAITGKPGDMGLFKVPTLKNISVTAPYMHDGRFATLNDVLDHYSHGIKPNANLSPLFRNIDGTPRKLNILSQEKEAIIAFLNTLKDDDFLTSPMYSDPFKK
jgi:cytochrome c peroxidase